jgi:hypothetical protein
MEQRNAKAEIPPNGMEISRLLTECSLLREALAEARRQLGEMKGKLAVAEGFYYRFEQTAEHNRKKLAASQQREHPDTARLDYLIEHFIDFREQPTPADFRDDIDRMMRHE